MKSAGKVYNSAREALSDVVRDGITVMSPEDAQRRMTGEAFATCNALECGGLHGHIESFVSDHSPSGEEETESSPTLH